MNEKAVVVGMSGGVDSATAALLLLRAGYEVTGVILQTWQPDAGVNRAPAESDSALGSAQHAAHSLGIPLRILDVRGAFREKVIRYFLDAYASGQTPNPCVRCNRDVKWAHLLAAAEQEGAAWIATGHYARLERQAERVRLLRGVDLKKDQGYFLSHLSQEVLQRTLLPNGQYLKRDIKEIAAKAGLASVHRPESQDLCFLEGHDYRGFIQQYQPQALQPGKIIDEAGRVLGQHEGLPNYTIGQRRGLGVASEKPLYVVAKNTRDNTLVLGEKHRLARSTFDIGATNWISGVEPPATAEVHVKIRSQAADAPAYLERKEPGRYRVTLQRELSDITPGQFAVFYSEEIVLGGGVILPLEPPDPA